MEKYNTRADVPEKYKWDLTDFYSSDEEFEKEYANTVNLVNNLNNYVGCTEDANKLYEFLENDINASVLCEDLYIYSYLVNDQELGNSKSMERKAKTEKLLTDYSTNVSFFEPELLKLDKNVYEKLFIDNNNLNEYRVLLDRIYRNKEHILTEREEIIINELNNAMDHFDDMSSTMLNTEHDYGKVIVDGQEEVLTSTNYSKLLKNENRDLRKKVREQFSKVVNQYGVSSSQFLDSYVKSNVAVSKIRKYNSCFESKRFGLNMKQEAYDALVSTVENHTDSFQRYFKLLKKKKNLDKLYQYDLNLSLTNSNKEYSIEDAQELCLKAIEPLGEEYKECFKKIIDNRYVDYAQYKGKCSGGYSFAPINKDSRILMSFNYNLDSVSTLVHEGGHNVHHQLISKNNPVQYRELPSLVCEVASLTNECLLSSYLAEHGKTKEEKLSGLSNIIDVINSNLFGSVREGHMEQEFYNYVESGGTITKDYMDKLTLDSLKKYYGEEVELDEYSNISWMRRSHYYMFFYLYAYAFCISIACNVASEITKGNKDMLDKYLKFLKTGGDKWPEDIFKILDIDICSKDVYSSAIKYYESLIDKYEEIDKEV